MLKQKQKQFGRDWTDGELKFPEHLTPKIIHSALFVHNADCKEETIKRVDNVWASGQFTDEEMSWLMLMLIIPKAHLMIKNSDDWREFQAMKKASVH